MLEVEARWLGQALDGIESDELSPLLNVGSASAEFRQRLQPWIDQWIFAPLRRRGVEVHHLDIRGGEGVDLCGDLTDDAFVAGLVGRGYRGLLCCNLPRAHSRPVRDVREARAAPGGRGVHHGHRPAPFSLSSRPDRHDVSADSGGPGPPISALFSRGWGSPRWRDWLGLCRAESARVGSQGEAAAGWPFEPRRREGKRQLPALAIPPISPDLCSAAEAAGPGDRIAGR